MLPPQFSLSLVLSSVNAFLAREAPLFLGGLVDLCVHDCSGGRLQHERDLWSFYDRWILIAGALFILNYMSVCRCCPWTWTTG